MDKNENNLSQWLNDSVESSTNCNAERQDKILDTDKAFILPELLNKTVTLLKRSYPNISRNVLTSEVIMKTSQMIISKRVKYRLFDDTVYPNYFAIIFMPSGYGKDKLSNELDNHVFKNFRLWFKNEEEKYYQRQVNEVKYRAECEFPTDKQLQKRKKYIDEECKKIRHLPIEVSKGTPEGLFSDAYAFQKAGFGCLAIKYGEFGLLLKNANSEDEKVIQTLFELFDGKVTAKSIKSENNSAVVEDIPCCALLYSDPTLFAKELKEMFNSLMQTGLGRRATISYLPETKAIIEKNPDIACENAKRFPIEANEIGEKFFSIFLNLQENSIYKITEDTYKEVFHPYRVELTDMANNVDNPLLKREINSRWFKAQKVSCIFAILNHVNEHVITPKDMKQAINVVNMLGEDFKSFLYLKPTYKDLYERVFEFFKEHLGKGFTATQLKRKYYKDFGCSRKTFNKEFEEIIQYVKEIAIENGYIFSTTNLQPSGAKYSLIVAPSGELSEGVLPLDELIKDG